MPPIALYLVHTILIVKNFVIVQSGIANPTAGTNFMSTYEAVILPVYCFLWFKLQFGTFGSKICSLKFRENKFCEVYKEN